MRRTYICYGLQLRADGEIPGLVPGADTTAPDVAVWLRQIPPIQVATRTLWYESPASNRQGRPTLTIWRTVPDDAFHFVYHDGTEFLIDASGSHVWCTKPPMATVDDVAVYLRGPVLGLVLRLRGILCLHASAIAAGDGAIAILGEAGAGKSTTAAGFLELGFPLLADDVAALDDDGDVFRVRAGYPRLNLWPDVGNALYGHIEPLPRVAPSGGLDDSWDKRYVELEPGRQFQSESRPLTAVYVLGQRSPEDGAPWIEALSAANAFMALTNQTYANYALDASLRTGEFQALGRLVRAVPVRMVTPHRDPARLMDLCCAILRDCSLVSAGGR